MDSEFQQHLLVAPPFLKPQLNLFLSVDIVGSTAYKQQTSQAKQSSDEPIGKWVTMVTHFYRDFTTSFLTECQKFEGLYKEGWEGEWTSPEEPVLWKAAGDELIFRVKLTDRRFSALFVSAWVSAIKSVRPMLQQDYSTKLNLKASAWVAGFPINNTEVIIGLGKSDGASYAGSHSTAADENMLKLNRYYSAVRTSSDNSEVLDFIGPSLDIGFRLGGFANPRRFICSVELAWLISIALEDKKVRSVRDMAENCEDNSSVFHISERQILKGVLDGIPYPIIWIDIGEHKEFNKIEDDVLGNAPLKRRETISYCEAFVKSCNVDYLLLPFINGETEPPRSYIQKYGRLISKWKNVLNDHEDVAPKDVASPTIKAPNSPQQSHQADPFDSLIKFVANLQSFKKQ